MREKIKDILKNILELDNVPEDITQETCSNWDSLHHLHLIIGLETEFNVSFEPEDIACLKSLNEIEDKIKDLQK
jgi:acyl carrier protein